MAGGSGLYLLFCNCFSLASSVAPGIDPYAGMYEADDAPTTAAPAPEPEPGPVEAPDTHFIDLSVVLPWIGIGLLGVYVTQVITTAVPLRLRDPAWINGISTILRGASSFPLEAMALILLGAYLGLPAKEPRLITRLRRLCSWVALGFLLLIPLQTWASQQLIEQTVAAQREQLQPAIQALKAIYAADNEEKLLGAIRTIPGAPPNINARLGEPYRAVRERLIGELEPQVRQREKLLKSAIGDTRNRGLKRQINEGLVALFTALAFAAVGRSGPYRPTLLLAVLQPGRLRHRVPKDVERWLDEERKAL